MGSIHRIDRILLAIIFFTLIFLFKKNMSRHTVILKNRGHIWPNGKVNSMYDGQNAWINTYIFLFRWWSYGRLWQAEG